MAPEHRTASQLPRAPTSDAHDFDEDEDEDDNDGPQVFVDPVFGTPLSLYVAADVEDRQTIVDRIMSNGGIAAPGYSNVPYILVDPHTRAGQNLYRQYVSKKNKIVLDVRWVHECLQQGRLLTVFDDWGGCKVTGQEDVDGSGPHSRRDSDESQYVPEREPEPDMQSSSSHSASYPYAYPPPDPYHALYAHAGPSMLHHAHMPRYPVPPPAWPLPPSPSQASMSAAPIAPPPAVDMVYRPDAWESYHPPPPHMGAGPSTAAYDYRYQQWAPAHHGYYDPPYQYTPEPVESYAPPAPPPAEEPAPAPVSNAPSTADKPRARKRTRNEGVAPIVRNPHERSPTPPSRVVKSQYGGNVFTQEDVDYLKRYIEHIQQQGLVMSLREVCERIAVKAPHHTFYSWRRYCNKHQIKLGGYAIDIHRRDSASPGTVPPAPVEQPVAIMPTLDIDPLAPHLSEPVHPAIPFGLNGAAHPAFLMHMPAPELPPVSQPLPLLPIPSGPPSRSPSPPRALYRSTTGKGVAFTQEDVQFLVRYLEYRKTLGKVDMVSFWKDVSAKAPHHSKASWMKYWRRHKHELYRDGTEDVPLPPEKKMRYSHADDILLARYFFTKPEGTSDQIFQAFARGHPHHPWKGWQEHHRIHKVTIDALIQQMENGESLELAEPTTVVSVLQPGTVAGPSVL